MTVIIVVPLACTLVLTVGGVWKEGVREGGGGGRGGEGRFYEDHPSGLIVQEQTQQG